MKYHVTVASIRTEPVIFLKLNDFHVIQCRFPLSLCCKLLHLYEKVGYLCTVDFFRLSCPNEFIFIKYVAPCDMKTIIHWGRGNLDFPIFAADNEVSAGNCMQVHSALTKL